MNDSMALAFVIAQEGWPLRRGQLRGGRGQQTSRKTTTRKGMIGGGEESDRAQGGQPLKRG
jgi:hypothetical protein